jgi:hypothetical protein
VAPPEDQLRVTPEELRGCGHDLLGVADQLHRDMELLTEQESVSAANRGFDCMAAAAECEQGWLRTLEILGGKLAASADTLVLNADAYATTDVRQAAKFRGR